MEELWMAFILGQYDLAKRLIDIGANVNDPRLISDGTVMTLLHYAAERGDIQGMRLLINHGANLHARDTSDCTPLHWAVKTGDRPEAVEMLINEGAVVDARDVDELTPLHLAVANEFNESAQKLIARGASMEAVNRWGRSILHKAVSSRNLSIVKVLISHRVNIDPRDIYGYTPLLLALKTDRHYHMNIIQLLLENGADVNTKCSEGSFPLDLASWEQRAVYFLLKWGARVNETSISTGNTALHKACNGRIAEVTALLLKFGADLNARNREGKTPFELLPVDHPCSEATARIVIREAIKRETLGQPLCYGYKQMVQSCEDYSQFDRECREEVKRMRCEMIEIEESAISFFYIFSTDEEKLAGLARNKKFVTAFETSDYLASFRIYAGELITKFEVAKKRANFLMSVEDCLADVLDNVLPAPILRMIAAYVKSTDIIENNLWHYSD